MAAAERPLLEIRAVTKRFGGLSALDRLSLTIGEGELRCIVGPNGCGKTTLFNVITGAFPPTGGGVLFRGREITGRKPHRIARLGIARKFQVPGIYPALTVVENLEVPLSAGAGRRGPLAMLGARPSPARLHELLASVNLAARATRAAGSLSHGEKQWLEIAMLLATGSELLLLDEPTAGMTVAETEATTDLIHRIRREHGVAILAIEHDMRFVERLDCAVMVMLRGAIFREGSYAEVQADPTVREVYLGEIS